MKKKQLVIAFLDIFIVLLTVTVIVLSFLPIMVSRGSPACDGPDVCPFSIHITSFYSRIHIAMAYDHPQVYMYWFMIIIGLTMPIFFFIPKLSSLRGMRVAKYPIYLTNTLLFMAFFAYVWLYAAPTG